MLRKSQSGLVCWLRWDLALLTGICLDGINISVGFRAETAERVGVVSISAALDLRRFFYAFSLPMLLGGILYMLRFMPAPDTHWAVKLDVGLAWWAMLGLLPQPPSAPLYGPQCTPPPPMGQGRGQPLICRTDARVYGRYRIYKLFLPRLRDFQVFIRLCQLQSAQCITRQSQLRSMGSWTVSQLDNLLTAKVVRQSAAPDTLRLAPSALSIASAMRRARCTRVLGSSARGHTRPAAVRQVCGAVHTGAGAH